MENHKDDINYDVAEAREKEVRHDVMSHVYAYGVQCPKAEPIIHLGATSCYVGDNTDIVIVEQIKQLKFICKLLNTLPLDSLKTLIEWRTMSNSSNVLGDKIQKIAFNFNKVFTGAKKQISKKKNAIYSVEHLFSEIIGQMYIKKYFSEKSKNDVIKIVNNLRNTFKEIILSKDWISDETKNIAIKKLETMNVKIGYPDKLQVSDHW